MATKVLQQTPVYTTTRSGIGATSLVTASDNNTYFALGDAAYYLLNGVNVPVVVRSLQVSGIQQQDGSDALYTVVGHIGSNVYPAGISRGPFRDVPASLLSSR